MLIEKWGNKEKEDDMAGYGEYTNINCDTEQQRQGPCLLFKHPVYLYNQTHLLIYSFILSLPPLPFLTITKQPAAHPSNMDIQSRTHLHQTNIKNPPKQPKK